MKTGKLYGIGVGIGDKEMLTLKAVRTLKELDVVVVPEAKNATGSTAYSIAKEFLKESVELVFMEFSMSKSLEQRKQERDEKIVLEKLKEGKNVGFLTIGDPMTYSTYIYLLEKIDKEIEVETVAGISSFADICSRVNIPLVVGDEDLKVISLHSKVDILKEIELSDNIVFMKIKRDFDRLKECLINSDNINNIVLVENSGKENEKVIYDIKDLKQEDIAYFSTLILKKGGVNQWKRCIS